MLRFLGLFLFLAACSSPEQRFRRLQRDFLKEFPRGETYLIVEAGDTLALPLPPSPAYFERIKTRIAGFQKRCKALESNALPIDEQQRCATFSAMLDSLSRPERQPGLHPGLFCQNDVLGEFLPPAELVRRQALLTVFIEKIPDYYARVQDNWPFCAPSQGAAAARCSVDALDRPDHVEANLAALSAGHRERIQKALVPARLAIKDFICRCKSSVLE